MRNRAAKGERWTAVFLGLLCLLPTLLYVAVIGRASQLDARQVRQLLVRDKAQVVFLEPLEESKALLFERATTVLSRLDPSKATLLFCRGGITSAIVALRLHRAGAHNVWSVQGGMQEWVTSGGGLDERDLSRLKLSPNQAWLHFSPVPLVEQGLLLFSFFGIKALYTFLAVAGAFVLWRRAEPELVAFKRALLAFVVGEASCFVNVAFFAERSAASEHVHGLLMAVSIGFTTFAVLHWLRQRLAMTADVRTCAVQALCQLCTVTATCRLRRLAQLLIPMVASLTLIPLTAEFKSSATTTLVFGRLHGYGHPLIHQWFELRYLPLAALGLLLACEVSLLRKIRSGSRIPLMLFSAAMGAFGFSLLRLMFVAPFSTRLVWFAVWEEFTELLYIAGILSLLWVFRSAWYERADVAQ